MQPTRTRTLTAITIQLQAAQHAGPIGSYPVLGLESTSLVDDAGNAQLVGQSNLPLVPGDFTDELLDTINNQLSGLSLTLSRTA